MTKRFYIAVGSTAINSMIALIERLKSENIYYSSNDTFVGIDSDAGVCAKLGAKDTNRRRVRPVVLEHTSNKCEIQAAKQFGDWSDLKVPNDGVFGRRMISFVALGWKEFWTAVGMDGLQEDDVVVLIGSAFGGTSTGLFWNVADFLRNSISNGTPNVTTERKHSIRFRSVLILPEPPGQMTGKYPIAKNLCAFLKDTQCAEWRQRLSNRLHFKAPIFSALEEPNYIPLWTQGTHGKAQTSNLPMEWMLVVPTGSQSHTAETVAEMCLTLFHFVDWRNTFEAKTGDRHSQGADANAFDEDQCVFGLNMVAARNSRNAILRRRFYEMLQERFNHFRNGNLPDNDEAFTALAKVIDVIMHANDADVDNDPVVVDLLAELNSTDIQTLEASLPGKLGQLAETTLKKEYGWIKPDYELLGKCLDSKNALAEKLTLSAICKSYADAYEDVKRKADLVESRKREIADILPKANRIQQDRGDSIPAAMTSGKGGARGEVREDLKKYLNLKFEEFKDACRCKATVETMPEPPSVDEFRNLFSARCEEISTLLKGGSDGASEPHPEFIHECAGQRVDLSKLDATKLGFPLNEVILNMITAAAYAERKESLKEFELKSIAMLKIEANRLGANNPLGNIKTEILVDKLKPFSTIFALPDSRNFHRHFCVKLGECVKPDDTSITWGDVVETKKLSFKSFETFNQGNIDLQRQFDPAGAAMAPQVEDAWNFTSDPGRADGGNANYKGDAQGFWLGTLGMDFSLGQSIKDTYKGPNPITWANDAASEEERGGAEKRRLLYLREMVYLGVVLGAVERKASEVGLGNMGAGMAKLNVQVLNPKGGKPVIDEKNVTPEHVGIHCDNGNVIFMKARLDWIKPIMSWIQNSSKEGFEFGFNLDAPDALGGHLRFENNILTDLRMRIDEKIFNMIKALSDKVAEHVVVEIVNRQAVN